MFNTIEITLLYKYGTTTPSADPNERIRPNDSSDSEIHYDAVEYMITGGGRYA
ncbi:hypothetical protein ABI_45300 [Asticcacaulis biprosthecium C19]|uniref:Uncharacterized protein n=1 Tax=Asticcacaulis biprosthecium C19 TaxID=715226 RepID=F4QTN3_9CAUL|nr:hypothetical protein ABI_45300 [Asticcacaulis biprosthecium C19]